MPQRSRFSFCQVLANKSRLWVEEEVWRMEIYLSLGVLALGVLSLLAVTSLPSIANTLNWREFSFVQVRQIPIRASCSVALVHPGFVLYEIFQLGSWSKTKGQVLRTPHHAVSPSLLILLQLSRDKLVFLTPRESIS